MEVVLIIQCTFYRTTVLGTEDFGNINGDYYMLTYVCIRQVCMLICSQLKHLLIVRCCAVFKGGWPS